MNTLACRLDGCRCASVHWRDPDCPDCSGTGYAPHCSDCPGPCQSCAAGKRAESVVTPAQRLRDDAWQRDRERALDRIDVEAKAFARRHLEEES